MQRHGWFFCTVTPDNFNHYNRLKMGIFRECLNQSLPNLKSVLLLPLLSIHKITILAKNILKEILINFLYKFQSILSLIKFVYNQITRPWHNFRGTRFSKYHRLKLTTVTAAAGGWHRLMFTNLPPRCHPCIQKKVKYAEKVKEQHIYMYVQEDAKKTI